MRGLSKYLPVFVAAVSLLGCSSSTGGAADCSTDIRFEGYLYSEAGFTERVEDQIGSADLAECQDTGGDVGLSFPDDPEQVAVWSMPGEDPATSIAIEYPDGGYRVMKLDGRVSGP